MYIYIDIHTYCVYIYIYILGRLLGPLAGDLDRLCFFMVSSFSLATAKLGLGQDCGGAETKTEGGRADRTRGAGRGHSVGPVN